MSSGSLSFDPPSGTGSTTVRLDAALVLQIMIIPNRYPVVEPLLEHQAVTGSPGGEPKTVIRPAHGVHEVIVEAAAHVDSILAIAPADWLGVWELCRQRLADRSTFCRETTRWRGNSCERDVSTAGLVPSVGSPAGLRRSISTPATAPIRSATHDCSLLATTSLTRPSMACSTQPTMWPAGWPH